MIRQKTILITGSNKGIGFEIARQCGQLNFHVIISGRNESRVREALQQLTKENISVDMLIMDVGKPDSIQKAVQQFSLFGRPLDVLVNNAGVGISGDVSLVNDSEAIFIETLTINSYGPLRVTKAFVPFMESPGRVVMISSGGGSMTDGVGGWWPAYCVSKTLLNAITRHLAYELESKNISVNAVCPGWVQTDMGGPNANRPVEKGAETPVWLATEASQGLTGKIFRDKKEIPW